MRTFLHHHIVKGTIAGLAAKLVSSVAVFVIIPLMLQQLGTTNFGKWMTISSAVSMMGFMDLGISSNMLSFIAKSMDDRAAMRKYISVAYTVQLLVILPLIILFAISFPYIPWKFIFNIQDADADIYTAIFITVISFLAGLAANTVYSIQTGVQRSALANTWKLVSGLISLVATWLLLLFYPSVKWVAFASVSIPAIVATINTVWFLSKEKLLPANIFRIRWKDAKNFLGNSTLLLYLQIAAVIAFQTDTLILAHYSSHGFEDVSRFSVMAKLFSVATILLNVYLQILWPSYAKAFADNNWQWIKTTFYRSVWLSIAIGILFLIALFFTQDILLSWWINKAFVIPGMLFIAFAVWLMVNIIDANIAVILNGLQHLKIQAIWATLMVIANLLLSYILVKQYGIAGVIWGTTISTALFSCIPLILYIRKVFGQQEINQPHSK
jgi:O-antigen/teichoic acid export membrane protein